MFTNNTKEYFELLTQGESEHELYPEMEFELHQEATGVSRKSPEYIKWVQSSLNKILPLNLRIDGIAGSSTKSAIRSFQSRAKLTVDGIVGPNTEAALIKAGAGHPPGHVPIVPPGPTPVLPVGGLRSSLVKTATDEWNRWRKGLTKEHETTIQSTLKDYWVTGTGSDYGYKNKLFWSAAFISWVVKKAGGGSHFRYSGAHTTYTYGAKQNRILNNLSPFKAYRITEKKPEPGDIIVQNRGTSTFTYENLQPDQPGTHGDVVVQVNATNIEVIGGNLSDSVSKKTYNLTSNGFLNSSKHFAIIKIEENAAGNHEFRNGIYPEMEFRLFESEVSVRNSKEYIKWVQASLNKIMLLKLAVDGRMGPVTRNAIRSFQKQKGLSVDGIVGPKTEQAIQLALVQSPPNRPSPSRPDSSIPPLISSDHAVPGYTFYVQIDLGNGTPQTGIFIPQKFSLSQPTDLIIYLHGHKKGPIAIDQYWDARKYPQYALREEVNNSNNTRAIFVAPTLGTRSEAPALAHAGGFDSYVNKVIAAINAHFIKRTNASRNLELRNIIICAHSGGGSPMLRILETKNSYNTKIKECWGFDSLYQEPDRWLKWSAAPNQRYYNYYSGTAARSRALKDKALRSGNKNIVVIQSPKAHDLVPKFHLKERVDAL